MIDSRIDYLLTKFKNKQAAGHLANEIDEILDRLEDNPLQFHEETDDYLRNLGYRRANLPTMDYHFEFRIKEDTVSVEGFFHSRENYPFKMIIRKDS